MGYTTYTCSVCGDSYVDTYVSATGHNFVITPAVAPGCTTVGYTVGVACACDEALIAPTEIPATGHSYTAEVTPPTYEADGYTTYTCSCGDSYVGDHTDKLVAEAKIGTTYYATLAEALVAAGAGDTVVLLKNVDDAGNIILTKGITLDLNGKKLTADYLVAFDGNHVVDSTRGTGLLIVAKDCIKLSADNNQNMAVWTGEGYKLASVNANYEIVSSTGTGFTVKFRPGLGSTTQAYLKTVDGVNASGMQIIVRFSWVGADGMVRYQDAICNAEQIVTMYTNAASSNKGAIGITLNNIGSYENLTATLIVISNTGAQVSQHMYTFNPTNS